MTGSHDKTLRIWNTRNWLCQHVIIAHSGMYSDVSMRKESFSLIVFCFAASVNCMDFDGARCVSGSSDR